MRKTWVFIAAALAAAGANAAPKQTTQAPAPKSDGISKEQAEKILAQCGLRRFEATAQFEVDGKMRRTGMRLCATPSDSDADWIGKLEKAAAAVEAQAGLPDSAKTKLLTDLRGEIARLTLLFQASRPAAGGSLLATAPRKAQPLPSPDALVATVPPMPPPLPRAKAATTVLGAASLLPPPPISIRCLESGERGPGSPCLEFEGRTVLAIKADADLMTPATLRFMRKDRPRGEIAVGPLRQGQVVQVRLPREVCSGVVRSQLAIEIVPGAPGASGPAAATEGPYTLRC